MADLPKGLRVYIIIIIGMGSGILIYLTSHLTFSWDLLRGFLFWSILVLVVESLPVSLPRGGHVTLGFPVVYAALLTYGPGIGSWVVICGTVMEVGRAERAPWYRMLFNGAQLSLSVSTAWFVYRQTGGSLITPHSLGPILPIIPSALAYFLINSLLVNTALALQQRISPWDMWSVNFRWAAPNYLAQTPLGFLMAVIYRQIIWWASLFLLVPLFIAHYAYKLYMDMQKEHLSTIQALAATVEVRDPYTEKHSRRMAEYAMATARRLGVSEDRVQTIQYAAILHDIGKIGISDQILSKRGPLTEEEWTEMKKHSGIGADILIRIDSFKKASQLVHYHHERYDGQGYPERLKGEDIPLGSRILAVVDAYDAMTSRRPYRLAYSTEKAIVELKKRAGTQFDARVVKAFLEVLRKDVT